MNNKYPQSDVSPVLAENLSLVKHAIQNPSDLIIREILIQPDGDNVIPVALVYIDGLADKTLINRDILFPLRDFKPNAGDTNLLERIEKRVITASSVKQESSMEVIVQRLLNSSTILFADGCSSAIVISSEGWEHRAVTEPITELVLRGPQDAFNEVLRMNTALLRRRIKDPTLVIDSMQLGTRSVTDIEIVYLKDICNPSLVREVKRRIEQIHIDNVLDGGQLEDFLEDSPLSPFPQIQYTERVDRVAAGLFEGKVAIIIDGTPFSLMVPTTFSALLYSPEDYYNKSHAATFIRWIRGLALFTALTLPAIYIALTTFHQEMLPTELMISIAAIRSGLPFPAFIEAIMMEITLELLREASLRLPGTMGQTIGIVGALVIGQAAVEANLVGPVLTIIVSFTAIGSFVIPNYATAIAIRLIRFPMMILAATLGLFGIIFGLTFILIHLIRLRSFGVSYLAGFTPETLKEIDDSLLIKLPNHLMKFRPKIFSPLNRRRQR